jgi:hypothetical protein
VLAAGDPAEHVAGVLGVPRLAEQLAVDHHDRVRRQDQLAGVGLRRRLLPGEPEDGFVRRLAGARRLVEIDRADGEAQAEPPQQLAAAGGGGGQDEVGELVQG